MIPAFLTEMLQNSYGKEAAEQILQGYIGAENRPVTFRANALKTTAEEVFNRISALGISLKRVPWYRDAFISENAGESQLKKTSLFERGEIYLQSLSSMLPPLYLCARAGEDMLDMTAAPGGKTTQLLALSDGKARITACEKDKVRAERLKFNLSRQGAISVTVLNEDACRLSEFFRFDKILLDAPCSGSGTLRTNEDTVISPKLVKNCAALQERLLVKALSLLKHGGELVYSTCSVLPAENEEVLQRALLRAGGEIVPVLPFEGLPLLPSLRGTICVCPTRLYEGFFVAKIKK